jgi:aryl-alcohol dehydrogenase-like predicted oxidoreductase
MDLLPTRPLGSSSIDVSVFSLGSWRTFERMPPAQGLAVMRAARDVGITMLDDARYNDETGAAPMPTGYSEVLFGDLFRTAGWERDRVVVANKLWWEFWPDQDAAAELDASLGRMGLDHVDLIYSMEPPAGLSMEVVVDQIGRLLTSGRATAWGIGNWSATALKEAVAVARATGVALPVAAQLPYSLALPGWVEDPAMQAVLDDAGIGLIASSVLAGGALTGKYLRGESGRATAGGRPAADVRGNDQARALAGLADEWDVTPASLAFSFVLAHPRLSSVLFGATGPQQVHDNVASLQVFHSLNADQLARLRDLATP